jgi:hypothetical protein
MVHGVAVGDVDRTVHIYRFDYSAQSVEDVTGSEWHCVVAQVVGTAGLCSVQAGQVTLPRSPQTAPHRAGGHEYSCYIYSQRLETSRTLLNPCETRPLPRPDYGKHQMLGRSSIRWPAPPSPSYSQLGYGATSLLILLSERTRAIPWSGVDYRNWSRISSGQLRYDIHSTGRLNAK